MKSNFCHFNRYVSNLIVDETLMKNGKKINSSSTHKKHTGKYDRVKWNNLENFLDDYLISSYDWRKEMGWDKNFINTNRNYLTMSIGYQIEAIVPIQYLKGIDEKPDDLTNLSELIIDIKNAYESLFSL